MNSGRLLVFEGLDGSGKTTLIKRLLEKNPEYVYSKAVASDTIFGKFARRHPSVITFMIDIVLLNLFKINPLLNGGKTILQDRYDLSVISFPGAERWYNQIAITLLKPLIKKPDCVAYLTVSDEERIKRLRKDSENPYHKYLIENPGAIQERERRYLELYDKFDGDKEIISTDSPLEKIIEDFKLLSYQRR